MIGVCWKDETNKHIARSKVLLPTGHSDVLLQQWRNNTSIKELSHSDRNLVRGEERKAEQCYPGWRIRRTPSHQWQWGIYLRKNWPTFMQAMNGRRSEYFQITVKVARTRPVMLCANCVLLTQLTPNRNGKGLKVHLISKHQSL